MQTKDPKPIQSYAFNHSSQHRSAADPNREQEQQEQQIPN